MKDKPITQHITQVTIPFPEFADFMYALGTIDEALDLEIKVTFDSWDFQRIVDVVSEIEDEATREYYIKVVEKWRQQ